VGRSLWSLASSTAPSVAGAQVVDPDARIVLFESGVEASGIKEIKVRTFEEVELAEGKKGTRVKETVWGTCPWFLSVILMFIAPRSLRSSTTPSSEHRY
jgi:hypothetical protein